MPGSERRTTRSLETSAATANKTGRAGYPGTKSTVHGLDSEARRHSVDAGRIHRTPLVSHCPFEECDLNHLCFFLSVHEAMEGSQLIHLSRKTKSIEYSTAEPLHIFGLFNDWLLGLCSGIFTDSRLPLLRCTNNGNALYIHIYIYMPA